MNSSANLHEYLHEIRRRLRLTTASRGVGAIALTALIFTVLCVFLANQFAFSDGSVISARTLLFAAVIAAIVVLLYLPLRSLNRRKAASQLEKSVPAFQGRMSTFLDETSRRGETNPLLELLAEDTLRVAETAPAERVVGWQQIAAFAAAGLAAVALLIWMGTSGPGYWGYGTARLWGGWLKTVDAPLYQIVVEPGSTTMRQGADLVVNAKMVGFDPSNARLFAKFASSPNWEEAPMQRRIEGNGFEFLFAGVREPFAYYVSADGKRSDDFDINVVEMPNIENIKLTYNYPKWSGLKQIVEDPGGDIRAVDGTEVEIAIKTDKPLEHGVLMLDDQPVALNGGGANSNGKLTVSKDGHYYLGAIYQGETVRLSEDFFVTMTPDNKPQVRLARPGRDTRATNIEEVVSEFEANDDFGLSTLEVHYSVNGGPSQTVPLQKATGAKQAALDHTFFLEDMGSDGAGFAGKPALVPGDIVSYYAVAKDHKNSVQTDMYFIEVQPFEREFYQSQQGGGMPGAGGQQQDEISRRQKEILAATWNLIKDQTDSDARGKAELRDSSQMLSEIQLTLREQAKTLAERTRARQLDSTSKDFASFVENLEQAAEFMTPAADTLRGQKLNDSIPSQQKALQHLLRAESIFREIQVSFGQSGQGGGGQAGRDLAEMFELEMDLEKNQYETGGGASGQQLEREIDEQLEKLRELARRQEKLAEQRQDSQNPSFAQRWQQEMLRREAEELKRKLEELQRRQVAQNQQQSQQGQQGQQGQEGQQGQRGQQGQQGSQGSSGGSAGQQRLDNIIKQLEQATQEMQASQNAQGQRGEQGQQNQQAQQGQQGQPGQQGQQQQGQGGQTQAQAEAAAKRAQARLQEALRQVDQQRRQQASSTLADIHQRANALAEQQQQIAPQIKDALKKALEESRAEGENSQRRGRLGSGLTRQQERGLAEQKAAMHEELQDIERQMQESIRKMGDDQRKTASAIREALVNLQQEEVATRLRVASEYIRQGAAPYIASSEDAVTRSLEDFRDKIREAEQVAGNETGNGQEEGLNRTLAQLESMRRKLEETAGLGQRGREQGQGDQPGQQGQGGRGQQGQQPGQQDQGQNGQQGQQGQGNQQGQGQPAQNGQPGQNGQQGQQGQQGGQQGEGGQQGQQGQRGQGLAQGQDGGFGPGGPSTGPRSGSPSAANFGDWNHGAPNGVWDPERRAAMEQALREGARMIPNMTNELRSSGIYNEDLDEIRKFVRNLPADRFKGNPKLLEQEYQKMLGLLEQLELQVRRQAETGDNTEVRAIVSEPVPEQYREAVAEYFRRLSKGK